MTPPQHTADSGLFAPVWAGTPAAAATSDRACLQAMLDSEAALARVQARLGTVPAAAARHITEAARAEDFDLAELAVRARGAANPVVPLVRQLTELVAARDPEAAHSVHQGSTSQDVLDTGLMLLAARTLDLILADLDRTAAALAALAARHRDTPMAARTLGQHAVPTTFGLKAAGWLGGVLDARARLGRLREQGLPVQLGGAAGTLAGYLEYALVHLPATAEDGGRRYLTELPAALAAELGLAEPLVPWHTVRTPLADLGAALALLTGALGGIAGDVQLLSRTESGEVFEPAAEGRGVSSAMPHKRNPALSALIRSAAYQVPALVGALMQTAVADDERPAGAWHAEWQPVRDALRLAGGAAHTAAELAEGLDVDAERMRANLGLTRGLVVSERLAALLSVELGRAEAKSLVARASATAATRRVHLAEVLAEDPALAGRHTVEELRGLLDPAAYTGAAGMLVDRVLDRCAREVPAGER
ncbi:MULTISPECIES: 3-carboxy-cis,cis-muconate cycloisomerase [Streptomyces]|uniref:Putative intramolecular lyase n=1 Tax=Streptomyces albus (strain ATCC 21838 / DSM 41398 / FERM P-419 / JCM 4703 / NBRC 107858) TaxID=1081613 RepID=A0A0B5ERR2_STRA4|nr:3-carboxy-cis,cis-muconate cycloisomerase [Streptomyces sp. SCSIO ZS0520]AJE81446.1 putative intramolecular lyase [Streptomyces albus]AOU75762.1 putative intramolecular lyase [Streptomyces albus]AYN31566.1 3-carboxy-cis,cis-muconate cycloisomerase [Streptomyces albus]UFZ14089.1 3-carboxy-cis, cis-muconate cycloisomerase [Streptomyces sp.]